MNREVFDLFKTYLTDRLSSQQHLTEDSVRYSYFSALIDKKYCKQHEIILELPHPNLHNAEIDTFLDLSPPEFIEFKYHRRAKSTSPKPQKAGSLFNDFNRMSALTNTTKKYVVYFTDSEMASYFDKHKTQYNDFWSVNLGGSFLFDDNFLRNTTDTFKKACKKACKNTANCRVKVIYSLSLSTGHEIRIFNVI